MKPNSCEYNRGDWLVMLDLKYAHFSILISCEHRKYLCSAVRNSTYHFNLPPIRFGLCPMGIYQDLKANSSSQTGDGDMVDCTHGQYSLIGRVWREGLSARPGYNKHRQAFTRTSPVSRVSGPTVNDVTVQLGPSAEKLKKIWVECWKLLEAG